MNRHEDVNTMLYSKLIRLDPQCHAFTNYGAMRKGLNVFHKNNQSYCVYLQKKLMADYRKLIMYLLYTGIEAR